jgi:hypothetical protein
LVRTTFAKTHVPHALSTVVWKHHAIRSSFAARKNSQFYHDLL